ncbi:MAG: outer membrane protein transport protein [Candidatus Cloacimonadota bacterium]
MKLTRMSLVLVFLVAFSGSLFAGGFALSGVGSRAISMGGAFRALADDGTSMYWNPAGLAFTNETNISLGGSFFLPSATWKNDRTLPGYITDEEYESQKKLRTFPSIFLTEENEARWKWGFSVYVPYGLGSTWDAYQLPTVGMPGQPDSTLTYSDGFPEDDMMSSIAVIDAHPTIAYKILDNLSIGAGASLMYGLIDLRKIVPPSADSPLAPYTYYTPTSFDMSGTGIGIGANFGVLYKPMPRLSLALTGRTPSTIAMKGDADIKLWIPDGVTLPIPSGVYGTTDSPMDITADLPLPAEIGGGLSFRVLPNMSVSMDYAYTMWSDLDKVTVELDEPVEILGNSISERDLIFKWEDTSRISVGTEYMLPCSSIRAGFYWEQSPIPDETQIPTLPDINDKISLNLGYGRTIGRWTVDLNGQYTAFAERVIDTPTADNMTGTYNANVISGNVGIGYRF